MRVDSLYMGLYLIWYKNNATAFFSMQVHACPLFQEGLDENLSSNKVKSRMLRMSILGHISGVHPSNKPFYEIFFESRYRKILVFNLEIK